jgi:hypothetical protein
MATTVEEAKAAVETEAATGGAKEAVATEAAEACFDVCETTNQTIIFIIFCVILLTLVLSVIILLLNIVNYILFTAYCINDSVMDYISENPDAITLNEKYKYRLLNYVKNTFDNTRNKKNTDKSNIDKNASDLYINKTIQYYNYIVKMVLLVVFVILMGFLYNIFRIGITVISQCKDDNTTECKLILTEILQKDTYIYYILIIICIYAYVHSYIYTYFFNKNIYKELYDIYNEKYKKIDTVVSFSINYINDNDAEKDEGQDISLFLRDLKNLSYDTLEPLMKDGNTTLPSPSGMLSLMEEGIINNNKFIVPIELEENEGNLNNLFKKIYKTPIADIIDSKKRELLVHKTTIYLIYHYVVISNIDDPLIIHKMNNIYLNLFENLYAMDNDKNKKGDPNYYLEQNYDIAVKDVLKEIRGAYTIKLLLPASTTKEDLSLKLKKNAEYIVEYIKASDKKKNRATKGYVSMLPEDILLGELNDAIDVFADGFFDYYQEDKTPGDINRVVYKINLYLAIEMMETIVFIVVVLLLLYNSGKYPYLEDYINTSITYAIAIINELISAILGII